MWVGRFTDGWVSQEPTWTRCFREITKPWQVNDNDDEKKDGGDNDQEEEDEDEDDDDKERGENVQQSILITAIVIMTAIGEQTP